MQNRTDHKFKTIIGSAALCISLTGCDECSTTPEVSGLENYQTVEISLGRPVYVGETEYSFTADCDDVTVEEEIRERQPTLDRDLTTGSWFDYTEILSRLEDDGINRGQYTITPVWDVETNGARSAKVAVWCNGGDPELTPTPRLLYFCAGSDCTE
ncbi:MAG: hypothetical protein AAGF11_23840 [Myxococcota bacterium]